MSAYAFAIFRTIVNVQTAPFVFWSAGLSAKIQALVEALADCIFLGGGQLPKSTKDNQRM